MDQQNDQRMQLARTLLGNGMAGQSIDMTKLGEQYDQMQMEGIPDLPPKKQWIMAQMQQLQQPQQGAPQMPDVSQQAF